MLFAPTDWRPDGRTSLEPDLLVVRRDRIGEKNIVEALDPGGGGCVPDSARIDRTLKFSRYAEGGIGQYWIVDPRVPAVEVYDLVDGEYRLTTMLRVTKPSPCQLLSRLSDGAVGPAADLRPESRQAARNRASTAVSASS